MDQFQGAFDVYTDVSAAGNHFNTLAKTPDADAAATITGSWTDNPHSGSTCIRTELKNTTSRGFGGFRFMVGTLTGNQTVPVPQFGDTPNAGYNLTGATKVVFWARGAAGGERVTFLVGGIGWDPSTGQRLAPYSDSIFARFLTVSLNTQWTRYEMPLVGDLSYIVGGFGWQANIYPDNPNGVVFFLDDIQYELTNDAQTQRLNDPRFIVSYVTTGGLDFDLQSRNTAFAYDNALAILAFLSAGDADSIRRARLIGDAFVYASTHDRSFSDGRIRDAYAGGDLKLPPGWTPNGRAFTVPVAGFYTDYNMTFTEEQQTITGVGNNVWTMLALLALHQQTGDARYLSTARVIGNFIRTLRNDTGSYGGFLFGYQNPESAAPLRLQYAATEHNLDVRAAFLRMYRITKEQQWLDDSDHAAAFVDAMFDSVKGCYLTGTADPNTRNLQVPLDPQSWSALALPGQYLAKPSLLQCPENNHFTFQDGFSGFDFNDDRDGVWFEGTGQMASAYSWFNVQSNAASTRGELQRAQLNAPTGDGFGIAAASHDGVSTGIDNFLLYQRLHIGATAWNSFAQLMLNPFYQAVGAPACIPNVTSRSQVVSSAATAFTLSVHAGASCSWSATSTVPWISVAGPPTGTGDGSVTINVAVNSVGAPRSATINVAGVPVRIDQGIGFADVPSTASFFTEIGKIAARGITLGCSTGVFCPDNSVTRGEMAAFIVRALGVPNPPTNVPQQFQDVPPSHPFYGFIAELARRGITNGCTASSFCPSDPVSRDQMAAFLIRTLGNPDAYTNVPARFGDVPAANPFYGFIDQMALREITKGCSATSYCPSQPVTRAQMAAFLSRAFGL